MNLKKNKIITTAFLCAVSATQLFAKGTKRGAKQPPLQKADFSQFAKTDTTDLFLLAGQSNMKGRGAIDMNPVTHPRNLFFHSKKEQWYVSRDPLHAFGTPDLIDKRDNAGTGPGMSFSMTLLEKNPKLAIGLIPVARGGAPINLCKGELYDQSLALLANAQKKAPLKTEVKAILWLQGESDATKEGCRSYEQKLLDLVDRYRADLNNSELPFIACTIGTFLKSHKKLNQGEKINEILLSLPSKRKHTACVDARDLTGHIGDRLHYNTESQIEIGKRFAKAYLKLTSVENSPPPYGVMPDDLITPVMTEGSPAPGKRVRQVASEYSGTEVYHTLYLPTNWHKGKRYPVIVEYTGNKWKFGPGTVDVANLGYGMSGGRDYIWVTMPYVEKGRKNNAVTWWGDRQATIDYCKVNLPRICKQWGGDPDRVIVCGFSRGAIATSYIGLADDQIASLWAGVFTFDHFDGHKKWAYPDSDRSSALKRLARLKGRPVLVGGHNPVDKGYLEDHLGLAKFSFLKVPTGSIFSIPDGVIQSSHTDMWMHRDSSYRRQVRAWLQEALGDGAE